jgi:hypothetical protein
MEEDMDCRRDDTERRLDAMDFDIGRPALSSNGSCNTPCSPACAGPFPFCARVCPPCEAAVALMVERVWLTVLPATTGGTTRVLFLENEGVVARCSSSGGGGDVGLGGGPMFDGPGFVPGADTGGGGSLGGGGSIIVGGLVRSTALGEALAERVADGRRGLESPEIDPLDDDARIPALGAPGAFSIPAPTPTPAATAAPVGRAMELMPGVDGPGMNWNC